MVKIQRASVGDLPQIASMEQDAEAKPFAIPYSLEEHARNISAADLIYLRILQSGVLAGFFILGLDPDGVSVEFRRIVVSGKGRGVGQAAIRRMERFCGEDVGRSRIWLDVFACNERGRHIYEKLGYRRFGEAGRSGAPMLLYEKQL